MSRILMILLATISYWSASQALATPEIVNFTTADVSRLSAEKFATAEPMLLPTVSAEELERMKREFRVLNPDIADQTTSRAPHDAPTLPGLLHKIKAPWSDVPYWSAGRLNFVHTDKKARWCTAQFVANHVLLTAAHCVFNRNKRVWYSDFTFLRASSDGDTPQEVRLRCISIYKPYYDPRLNYAYDYAFLLTQEEDVRPPLKMATGAPASRKLTAIGYTGKPEDGRFMYRVKGSWIKAEGGISTMNNNPMTTGSSGGAWFKEFKAGEFGDSWNQIIGINSHRLTSNTEINSPLFTNDTIELKDHVEQARCLN